MAHGEMVGVGRTAEVLAWDEGHVIKLYRAGFRRGDAAFEAQATARIHQARVAAPAVLLADTPDGLFEEDGRFGVVFERVQGPSMLHELVAHPLRVRTYGREFARLHAEMHAARILGLPSQRDGILHAADRGAAAAGRCELALQVRERVSELPDGDAVCHGDFHPDNVLLSGRGPILIDWGSACRGSAAADVARTVLLVTCGGYPVGSPLRARILIGLLRRLFLRVYLGEYVRRSGATCREIEAWLGVMAVARLAEGIAGEDAALLAAAARHLRPVEREGRKP